MKNWKPNDGMHDLYFMPNRVPPTFIPAGILKRIPNFRNLYPDGTNVGETRFGKNIDPSYHLPISNFSFGKCDVIV
jgi:hypothetical protein